jgi:hypothetical protein
LDWPRDQHPAETPKAVDVRQARETMEPRRTELMCRGASALTNHDSTEGTAGLANRRQQTQAKAARERTVRERRERKQEKKRAAAAERKERAAGDLPPDREDVSD